MTRNSVAATSQKVSQMVYYIEQTTVVRIPVVVKLEPGTRVDASRGYVYYSSADGNVWYGCALAAQRGLITVSNLEAAK